MPPCKAAFGRSFQSWVALQCFRFLRIFHCTSLSAGESWRYTRVLTTFSLIWMAIAMARLGSNLKVPSKLQALIIPSVALRTVSWWPVTRYSNRLSGSDAASRLSGCSCRFEFSNGWSLDLIGEIGGYESYHLGVAGQSCDV